MRKKLAVLIAVITAAMMLFGCGGKDMSGSEYLGKWKATKAEYAGIEVGVDTVFDAATEVLEEALIGFAVIFEHLQQVGLDLLLELLGDGTQLAIVLKRFARDVEREVLAVHHTTNEVEVIGQQLLAFLHDEHV